ncbi:hypothetical protein DFH06DRAFT_1223147 [Mycena polygramma]|nr:hypothetical protein DFH06DRAFT_1223147 [Mycena polygramma]
MSKFLATILPKSSPSETEYLSTHAPRRRRRSFLGFRLSEAPPAYTPPADDYIDAVSTAKQTAYLKAASSPDWLNKPMRKETLEDALLMLKKYDTVVLMDDSGSMTLAGSNKSKTRWSEACDALEKLADIAAEYDTDGIDIYFLNSPIEGLNLTSTKAVKAVFDRVEPGGGTYTGARLDELLRPYLADLEAQEARRKVRIGHDSGITGNKIKPRNIIVITDGAFTDDPAGPIIECVQRLQAMPNLGVTQLGIQFVQIGDDDEATKALKELDDNLHQAENIRDIVDTTPYSRLNPVTADGLIKVLLGGINRRIDRQT